MERTFAGFWRDGAKVQPSEKHWRWDNAIFIVNKRFGATDVAIKGFGEWEDVYWLDTTTPTELTPQEAFELLKVISPTTSYIEPRFGCEWIKSEPFKSIINWGDTTEYPPKQKWRVPTDADKGKRCRMFGVQGNLVQFPDARFCCIHLDGSFVVDTGSYGLLPYPKCEVLE